VKYFQKKIEHNIFLVYILTILRYSWFWIAIWVLYYLRFTNYAGVGILESIMILTTVIGEIPTGAIADLLGKKYTLTLSFLFSAIGNLIMGFAPSFSFLALGIIGASIGGVLTSGTTEALVYDSLLTIKKEETYQKVLGNISSFKMIALAVSSIIGGLMYKISPGLPFLIVGVVQFLGLIFTLMLTEPPVDTEVFSFKNYIKQTSTGFKELFKSEKIGLQNILIIAMTMIVLMDGQVLIDAQLVAQGWSATQLGFIAAIMFLASAIIGQFTAFFSNKIGSWLTNIFASLAIALTMILIPFLGIFVGTIFIMLRNGILEIFGNSASKNINKTTQSKYRATTLSTYSMLASIPYIAGAYMIGKLMDTYSVHVVTSWLGLALAIITLVALLMLPKLNKISAIK
jgi:MFS family permease